MNRSLCFRLTLGQRLSLVLSLCSVGCGLTLFLLGGPSVSPIVRHSFVTIGVLAGFGAIAGLYIHVLE